MRASTRARESGERERESGGCSVLNPTKWAQGGMKTVWVDGRWRGWKTPRQNTCQLGHMRVRVQSRE